MSSPTTAPNECPKDAFLNLLEKLHHELPHLVVGHDFGLLPINSFLLQLDEMVQTDAFPQVLRSAIRLGLDWIDRILSTTAVFDANSIERFARWADWVKNAGNKLHTIEGMPSMPANWDSHSPRNDPLLVETPSATDPITPGTNPSSGAEEPTLVLNLQSDTELLGEFINESKEHLTNLENGMLVLEERPDDEETLNSIFRAFHTFKGSSGFLNLGPIKDLAHELESVLDAARQGELKVDSNVISLLLEGGDTLRQFVEEIETQLKGTRTGEEILIPTLDLLARVKHFLTNSSPKECLQFEQTHVLTDLCKATANVYNTVETDGPSRVEESPIFVATESELTEVTPSESGSGNETAVSPTTTPKKTPSAVPAGSTMTGVVKVDTLKLDSLIDLVGELIISQSMVVQDKHLLSITNPQLVRNLAQLRRITTELQRTAMSLRMVPIRSTFQKMTRLVRDLASKQNKRMQLLFSGEDTELDRNIVDALGDPLIHMVRNSVDHGLEIPETRIRRGKPAMGTIHLRAFHQGGNIVIQISDDGGGLNKERIRAKAVQNGLIGTDQVLSDAEIYSLIFAAGFSTAEKVTEISGRGVGMDVVRRNIERLRGKIEIESVEGQGTTFSIFLPLTLAIIDGMIVRVGGQRFIIPTLSVRESFRPSTNMISTLHESAEIVNVRGNLCPLLRLHQYFDCSTAITDPTNAILVVVESGAKTRCLMVDELIGKQEVVIKSLGETFKSNRALAGGAVLWDGRVGLILDVDSLVQLTPIMAFAG